MYANFAIVKPNRPLLNTFSVFVITLLGCVLGAHARISSIELSVFWPINVIIAALFYRYNWLNRPWYYLVSYAAMVLQDSIVYGWGLGAFTINSANIVFMVTLVSVLSRTQVAAKLDKNIYGALYAFMACMLAAVACGIVGALAQQTLPGFSAASYGNDFLNWAGEQFYTSVLFLPLLLTFQRSDSARLPTFQWKQVLPLLCLVVSLAIASRVGSLAILALPLPALTWCALAYPLWLTRLITLCTGIAELILMTMQAYAQYSNQSQLFLHHITIARICIGASIFSPLLMSINARTIRQLNDCLMLQASHDFLTGALSRYGFTEALAQREQQSASGIYTVNMMLIDIDHFKSINDTYGHNCGDIILQEVAQLIQQAIAAPGLVCRIGGEEFEIVCFDHTETGFYQLAETLRQQIENHQFTFQHQLIPVTISVGLTHADVLPSQSVVDTVNRLFSSADRQLYLAKGNGRNRTMPAVA